MRVRDLVGFVPRAFAPNLRRQSPARWNDPGKRQTCWSPIREFEERDSRRTASCIAIRSAPQHSAGAAAACGNSPCFKRPSSGSVTRLREHCVDLVADGPERFAQPRS